MKIDMGKIAKVLLVLYKALLSGKTIKVNGTEVKLPSRDHEIPR